MAGHIIQASLAEYLLIYSLSATAQAVHSIRPFQKFILMPLYMIFYLP